MDRKKVDLMLKSNLKNLTRQQLKTLRGQLRAGEVEGAYKGLVKILKRRYKETGVVAL